MKNPIIMISEKIIISMLFVLFTLSLDRKKTLLYLSNKFAVFYKYYHFLFWILLNIYLIIEYIKFVKERKIFNHLLCITSILVINILIYLIVKLLCKVD